jgi:hypothetical protein
MDDTETVRFSHLHPEEFQIFRNGKILRRKPEPSRKISFKKPPQPEIIPDFVNPDTSISHVTSKSSVSVKKAFYKFNLPEAIPQDLGPEVLLPILVQTK